MFSKALAKEQSVVIYVDLSCNFCLTSEQVVLYSQKNFLGERLEVTESLKVLPDAWLGGAIASIRVLSGW